MRLLVVGYFGYGIVGDDAVLEVVLRDIRVRWPTCEVVVTSADLAATAAQYDVETVRIDLAADILDCVSRSDGVILASAGGMNEYAAMPPYVSMLDPLPYNRLCCDLPAQALLVSVPCVIVGAGVADLHTREALASVQLAFETATAASVRDRGSLEAAMTCGVSTEAIALACDPAWAMDLERPSRAAVAEEVELDPNRPIIGLTLRHWDMVPMRLSSDEQEWEQHLAAALANFCKLTSAQLLFIPHHHKPGWIYSDDVEFAQRMISRLPGLSCRLWSRPVSPRGALEAVSVCDMSVAMRHHGAIFGAVAGVPTLAIAYSEKVSSAYEDAGLADWTLPLADLETNTVSDRLAELWRNRGAERARLEAVRAERRRVHHSSFMTILDALETPPAIQPRQQKALRSLFAQRWITAPLESASWIDVAVSSLDPVEAGVTQAPDVRSMTGEMAYTMAVQLPQARAIKLRVTHTASEGYVGLRHVGGSDIASAEVPASQRGATGQFSIPSGIEAGAYELFAYFRGAHELRSFSYLIV